MSIFYISSGTKNFLIHGSYDKSGDWVLLANGTLEDPRTAYEDCTVPPVKVSVGKQDYPFVRFTAVDFYGLAAALMYFSVEAWFLEWQKDLETAQKNIVKFLPGEQSMFLQNIKMLKFKRCLDK